MLATPRADAETLCAQRDAARALVRERRSEAALQTLADLESHRATDADRAAVRLDRAGALLDLWRVAEARGQLSAAAASLLASSGETEGACGEGTDESSIRLLELWARSARVAGCYQDAVREWSGALTARRSQRPLDTSALVSSLVQAADAHWLAGDLERSGTISAEALGLATAAEPRDDAALATALERVALHASARGEHERAEALYQRALEHSRGAWGDGHPSQAGLWLSIGALAVERADLLTADVAYDQAAAILDPLTDASLASDKATLALNQGSMHARFGRIDEARASLERARELWTRSRGPDHPHLAWVDEAMSTILVAAGRLDEADPFLARAVASRERAMPASASAVLTAARLAALRARAGRAAEARALWRRVDASAARVTSPSPFFHATLDARRAESAEAVEDLASAARLRARVEIALRRHLPAGHPALADAQGERARLARRLGRRGQALRFATAAWQVQRRAVADTIAMLPESDALVFLERSRDLRDLLLCAVAEAPEGNVPAVDVVMRELAASRGLISGAQHARNRSVVRPSPTGGQDELVLAERRYASLLWQPVSTVDASYGGALAGARAALQELERRHVRRHERPAPHPDAGMAWGALGPRDALVAFGRYRCPASTRSGVGGTGYLAFVRRADRPARVVRFPDGAGLERAVARWHEAIAGAVHAPPTHEQDEEIEDLGRALARELWVPLAAALGTATRIFVVPDGALHAVSWYALPGASTGYLLDEQRLVHVLTAETDLVAPSPAMRSEAGRVVVLADPLAARASTAVADAALGSEAGQIRSACRFVDLRRLPRLEQAMDEARDVEDHATSTGHGVDLATGSQATESWLRSHARGARILHLAVHGGRLRPESCREPSSAAGPTTVDARALWEVAVRARPLMQSGLLLTGAAGYTPLDAPGTEDDGVLVAEEAARLDLRGADWVVLSACSTRRGPVVDAEGALGLHRAFHAAGARTVIASLWDVQDAPARRFMQALSAARLRDGKSTAEAVRDAQRAVLAELRASGRSTHPVQWAAFVASGDWR